MTDISVSIAPAEIINVTASESGPQGEQGIQGEQGVQGEASTVAGPQGEQGIQGEIGLQGETGEQGIQGEQGIPGLTGEQGSQGETGEQGIQGERGEKGNTGNQGIQGVQGIQGLTGNDSVVAGPTGPQGDTGAQGERGITGDIGLQGETGETGPSGVVQGLIAGDNIIVDNSDLAYPVINSYTDNSLIDIASAQVVDFNSAVSSNSAVALNTAKETNISHPLVEAAVPSNAIFTDTVYDDTLIQSEVDLNTTKVGITTTQSSNIISNNAARHTHTNSNTLDKFGENSNGLPTYNGNQVETTIAQRDIYDGLDSVDNTISLSAKQGKVLKDIQDTQQTEIDLNADKISFDPISSIRLINTSGTNTGDQDLSGYVPYTGATTDVDLVGNNLYADSIGVGTDTPESTLDVMATAISGAEQIAKFHVYDADNSYFSIESDTSISGSVTPKLVGKNGDDARNGITFESHVEDSTWYNQYYPAMIFEAKDYNGDAINAVPVVAFTANNDAKLTTWHDGATKIGGFDVINFAGGASTRPDTMLDVINTDSNDLLNLVDGTTSRVYVEQNGDISINGDNQMLYFGDTQDASITYTGSYLKLDASDVRLTSNPTGDEDLAVATVEYVNRRVGFSAKNSNTFLSATGWHSVVFLTEEEDTDGAWDGTFFTAPTTGLYEILGHATFTSVTDGNRAVVGIDKNGSLSYGGLLGRGTSGATTLSGFGGGMRLFLTAGDVINMTVWCDNTTSLYNLDQPGYTTFSCYLMK